MLRKTYVVWDNANTTEATELAREAFLMATPDLVILEVQRALKHAFNTAEKLPINSDYCDRRMALLDLIEDCQQEAQELEKQIKNPH